MQKIKLVGSNYANLNKFPDSCPYCHKSIEPNYIIFNEISREEIEVVLKCPSINCQRAFVAKYFHDYHDYYNLYAVSKGEIKAKDYSEHINNISPNFVKIYNQAYFAEQHNLLEICGVGYRKALEFLIKDYLITKNSTNEDTIKKKPLGQCIIDDVDDSRVKKVSKRAVWLGNDETHYVRKWEGKNLEDLKKLISLTIHWIEMDYLTEEIENDMPDKN